MAVRMSPQGLGPQITRPSKKNTFFPGQTWYTLAGGGGESGGPGRQHLKQDGISDPRLLQKTCPGSRMAAARPLIGLQVAKEEEPAGPSVLVLAPMVVNLLLQIRGVHHGQLVLGLSTLFWNLEGRENLQDELMALIGEQFDETKDICGIVASVRQRGDKLALWTRTASNEAVQDDSRKDKSSRVGRYTV